MAKEAEAKALESRVTKLETELELLHQMYHRLARKFDQFSRETLRQAGDKEPIH